VILAPKAAPPAAPAVATPAQDDPTAVRVYDPSIGRFLSADPTIQYPYNTQDYNRYSYTTNNPLKYVDMNGFGWLSKTWGKIWKAIKKYDKVILSAVIAYYTGGFVTGSAWANCTAVGSSWAGVATAGAAGGALNGWIST
jgi:hypothetical protein